MKSSTYAIAFAFLWWLFHVFTGDRELLAFVIAFTCTAFICRAIERNRA